MMTLSDLISKLEGVTEGSRELDWAIRDQMMEFSWPGDHAPPFSTSVDAALTLVPQGLEELCVETTTYSNGLSEASLCWGPCEPFNRQSTEGEAKTLPLAICIASLKSRSV